ncbi:hypothetical protein WR25_17465 [Diploscapter pachys]|uniref:ShKT domain-containing protein n=1 Tax=Diploscapter pachys TaxID=2018661 RepID=A0A2A2K717_9BILA|nr:hypothetical protein WR25_17465 [Diploscapter pachys]
MAQVETAQWSALQQDPNQVARTAWNLELDGTRPRGRPKTRYIDTVKKDMEDAGLRERDARDRKSSDSESHIMIYLLFILSLATVAYSQTCSDGGQGPCLMGNCPGGFTCLQDGSPDGLCCNNVNIVTTTIPPVTTTTIATTTTTITIPGQTTTTTVAGQTTTTIPGQTTTTGSGTCVDKLNPKTGVSGRCSTTATTTASSTCVDKLNPNTGVSGRCGASATTTASSTCVDKLNPNTGVSDCPGMASYCSNTAYYDVMTDQCPKTCGKIEINRLKGIPYILYLGRCGASGTTTARSQTTAGSTCVDKVNPNTGVSDCPSRTNLCNDSQYYSLMTDQVYL